MPVAVYKMGNQTKEISPIVIRTATPIKKRYSFRYGQQKTTAKAQAQTAIFSTITRGKVATFLGLSPTPWRLERERHSTECNGNLLMQKFQQTPITFDGKD